MLLILDCAAVPHADRGIRRPNVVRRKRGRAMVPTDLQQRVDPAD